MLVIGPDPRGHSQGTVGQAGECWGPLFCSLASLQHGRVSPGPRALLAVPVGHNRGHKDRPRQVCLQDQVRASGVYWQQMCSTPSPLCKAWSSIST